MFKFCKFKFQLMSHPCYFREKSKSLKFSQFDIELIRDAYYFREKSKSFSILSLNFNSSGIHVILGRKGSVSIFSIRIRTRIHEALMFFWEGKRNFIFSQFEFQLMRHVCYFRKNSKSLSFLDSNSTSN